MQGGGVLFFPKLFEHLEHQARIQSLNVLSAPSLSAFHAEAGKGYPFLIEGIIAKHLNDREFVLKRLSEELGDVVVQVRHGDYASPENYISNRKVETLSIAEYISSLFGSQSGLDLPYIGNHALPDGIFNKIEFRLPEFYKPGDFNTPRLWLGPKGATTPLHKDITDNFSYQLFGNKRWVVFPVRDFMSLYMKEVDREKFPDFSTSSVDIRKPDLVKFPLFSKAVPLEFEVKAGQVLYLPAGWAHFVENVSASLMINCWCARHIAPAALPPAS